MRVEREYRLRRMIGRRPVVRKLLNLMRSLGKKKCGRLIIQNPLKVVTQVQFCSSFTRFNRYLWLRLQFRNYSLNKKRSRRILKEQPQERGGETRRKNKKLLKGHQESGNLQGSKNLFLSQGMLYRLYSKFKSSNNYARQGLNLHLTNCF